MRPVSRKLKCRIALQAYRLLCQGCARNGAKHRYINRTRKDSTQPWTECRGAEQGARCFSFARCYCFEKCCFQMYQAKLFENQSTRDGIRKYAASVHYHYVTGVDSPGSYSGHRIVFSTMTEMLAHVSLICARRTSVVLRAWL